MAFGLSKKQFAQVFILLFATLVCMLNQTFLSPALPSIMAEMDVSSTTVQWLSSGYAMVEAVVIPTSAFLMGRLNTRTLYIASMSFFIAGSVLAVFAPNFYLLLLGRILQAICTGSLLPCGGTLTLIAFPKEHRGSAMGLMGLIIGFAPAIGPSLSGFLVDFSGWRILFVIVSVLAIIMFIIGIIGLPNHDEFERVKFDFPSIVTSTLGLGLMLFAFSTFSTSEHVYIPIICLVIGLIFASLYVRRQLTLEHPMLRVNILKTKRYRYNVIIVAIMQGALMATGVLLPVLLQTYMGYSALDTGLLMLPGAVLGAVCGLIAGRLFDKHGVRKIAIPGIIVVFIGAIGHVFFSIHVSIWFICFWYTFLGIGLQFTFPPLNTWGVNSLDNALIQHQQSVSNTLNQVGGSLGTALLVSISALGAKVAPTASALEQGSLGIQLAFGAMCVILFIVMIVVILCTRDKVAPDQVMSVADSDNFNAGNIEASAEKAVAEKAADDKTE